MEQFLVIEGNNMPFLEFFSIRFILKIRMLSIRISKHLLHISFAHIYSVTDIHSLPDPINPLLSNQSHLYSTSYYLFTI